MIIDSFNKKYSGQTLLIVIMIIATILTVFLLVSFKSITETQLTKLEEENQKALAAAQAGLEVALSRSSNILIDGTLSQDFAGFSGNATIVNEQTNQFVTPLINKDAQYTFYLANYNPQTKNFSENGSTPQNIHVCFNQNGEQVAVEISLIKSDGSIKKYAYNSQVGSLINNAPNANLPDNNCPKGENFNNRVTISSADIGTNSRLLIVRVIGGSSKIGFKASSNFPPQGRIIVSTAKSPAGVEKKIQLFQSYPQIPSDFFVTSF